MIDLHYKNYADSVYKLYS